ncbi:MAG: recombinase family protein, partial [Youngiibacter sp.]|nr:recombinase family protein [Youngiibacter sp.]
DYYPAIIDPDTFAAVQEERIRRASALGRIHEPKEAKVVVYPSTFHIIEGLLVYDDPFAQAEYAYSLIESEV